MALGYDGSIRIDTKIDSKGFSAGINSMGSSLKKLAGVIGVAFGTAAIVNFGKETINVASQLSNAWIGLESIVEGQGRSFSAAKSFINDYISDGLVPLENAVTAYKNLAARGYDDEQIQKTLVALKDAAAFGRQASYSLGDAVTSATEGLKNENSVLVDNAGVTKNVAKMWDDYAKSIGTTANNLTQQQKIQAEVNGILAETRFQTGDAAKLADTYSGQLALLSYNFQQLKVNVGNALIPIAEAVLPSINAIITALSRLAGVFAQVSAMLFGKSSGLSQQAGTQKEIAASGSAAADATEDLAGATADAGTAAKKAEKDMKGVLAGFDELNILATNAADSVSDVAGGMDIGADLGLDETTSGGELFGDAQINPELEKGLQRLIDKAEKLQGIFMSGFHFGSGNIDFSGITDDLEKIGEYLRNIFTGPDVAAAAERFVDSFVHTLGVMAGSFVSVGVTIAQLIVGGIELFLRENVDRIKEWIIRMFNVRIEINGLVSAFAAAFAGVFSVFGGESAKRIVASIIQIFIDVFMGVIELAQKFARDMIDLITTPFVENKDAIKEALEGFFEPVAEVMDSIKYAVREAVDGIVALYDEHIHPFIMSVKEAFTEWFAHILDGFNTYIKPVLDDFAKKFDDVVQNHVKPMIEKALEYFGKAFDMLKWWWDNVLSPLFSWIIDIVVPIVAAALDQLGNNFKTFFATISDVFGAIFDILSGFTDFLMGVFTGDWKKAWEGIKTIFRGIWNGIVAVLEGAVNLIVNGINGIIKRINGVIGSGLLSKGLELIGVPNGKIPTISEVKIPRLANGAVIPPNQQFAAVLGDQRSGKNLEAPASLIKQMVTEALAEAGGIGRDRPIEVNVILDKQIVGRVMVNQINDMTRAAGKPVLLY